MGVKKLQEGWNGPYKNLKLYITYMKLKHRSRHQKSK
jgi:hypothetical protein